MKLWLGLLLFVAGTPALADHAHTSPQPITIGEAHIVASVPLREVRVVNVVLPASYAAEPRKQYPVLYIIDGGLRQDLLHVAGALHLGAMWGRSAEAIVVGIETKDRRKELVGPTKDPELLKRYPTAGYSEAFRTFIRDEVKPLVRRRYRTDGKDAVVGESLAGLFVLETYLSEPTLFGAYAAIDPSLWWDQGALSRSAAAKIKALQTRQPLYLAAAKEQLEDPAPMDRVISALTGRASHWCLVRRPDLLHATIYQQLTPEALQFLVPPPEPPPAEFGFNLRCTAQGSAPQVR